MRILQVVHGFPPHEQAGAELVTFYLSQALRARDHQVAVMTRVADPEAEEFSVHHEWVEGLEVIRVVNNHGRTSARLRFSYDNSFFDTAFLRLLERLRPDVIHFQHLAHLSVSLIPLAASVGYPTVLSLHDFFFPCHRIHLIDAQNRLCPGPERGERCVPCLDGFGPPEEIRRRFAYMEHALQVPDLMVSPSAFLARKIIDYFPFLQDRLRVVALGLKPVPTTSRSRPPGAPLRLLYVGLLFPPKGAHILIEAIKGLPTDTFAVSLYGAMLPFWQPYVDRLRAEADGLPVHFCGSYPHESIAAILSQHDVLVMPTICEETFSLVTREALMAGLPVVAARRGALPDIVQDGVNGLLFEAEDAMALHHCLRRLITEPGLLERLRVTDAQVKTMDEYAREMESLYAEVRAEPYRLRTLQRNLAVQYRAYSTLSQEHERVRTEVAELRTQNALLLRERETLRAEKDRVEQEWNQALATAQELRAALYRGERLLREQQTRLDAIYASLTWKLYRCYATLVQVFFHRPLGKLKQWLVG